LKKNKLHILFLPSWYPSKKDVQNGVFIQKQAQAVALTNRVSVISIQSDKKSSIEVITNGDLTEHIAYFKASSFLPTHILRFVWTYYKLLKTVGSFDIIHAHVWSKRTFFSYLLSLFLRKPLTISEHWSGYKDKLQPFERFFCKVVFKKASSILVVSNFLQSLMEEKGIKGNYQIIGNVVEKQEHLSIATSPFKFLVVADLRDEIKNVSGIIRAFKKLEGNVTLNITGGGTDKQRLAQEANNRICFKGRLENSDVLYQIKNHHCLVINSRIETFSVVALESLAAGKPIIFTRCGGPEEIIPENCGIPISINNEQELYDAMQSMITNHTAFSPKELQSAVEKFYPEKIGAEINKVYHNVLQ
jgi:L-malate glycosyltransferase